MLVKCPQCRALLEAEPGQTATCKECGFTSNVATAPSKKMKEPAAEESGQSPAKPRELLAPFSLLAGVAGLATFYLAPYYVPLLLSAAALALGISARQRVGATPQSTTAIAMGAAGLLLGVAVFAFL